MAGPQGRSWGTGTRATSRWWPARRPTPRTSPTSGCAEASRSVHPKDAKLVAAATAEGPYLSRDAARSFDLDGEQLWFASFASQASLWRIGLKAGALAQPVNLPALGEDAVAYLAQHPQRRAEIAIATFKRSVYLSPDQGGRWTQIAKDGATR